MYQTEDYVLIAFYLSFLTYYMGVLIYSLPIPIYSLKKWGPMMIRDSILVFILLVSLDFLRKSITNIASLIGSNWTGFYSWNDATLEFLAEQRLMLIMYYTAFRALKAIILYGDILGPLIRLVSYNIIFLYSIRFLGYFFQTYWFTLIAMGIMLIALPFRIGRSAGAWLIAIAVTFYIGLPLLPVFIQLATPPLSPITEKPNQLEDWGISYLKVYTAAGTKNNIIEPDIPVEFKTYINGNEVLIARYISRSGIIDATHPDKGLPAKQEYYAYYIIDGLSFPVYPYPVNPSSDYTIHDSELTLYTESPYVINIDSNYNLVYKNMLDIDVYHQRTVINQTSYSLKVEFKPSNKGYIGIRLPENTGFMITDCSNCNHTMQLPWKWLGLRGTSIKVEPVNPYNLSRFTIVLNIKKRSKPNLNGLEYDYVRNYLGVTTDSIYYILSNAFFKLILMPAIYIAILMLVARQIARILGTRIFPYIPVRG
jgi:hypothetical protein